MFGIGNKKKVVTLESAGTLKNFITDEEKFSVTELVVTGELNGTDLKLIREMAGYTASGRNSEGKLKRLDLKNARFVPGGEKYARKNDGYCTIEEADVIPQRAFRKCDKLQVAILPEGTKKIEGHAFERCTHLSSITIPEGVEYIGSRAFRKCYELKTISIPSTVVDMGKETFSEDGKLGKLYVLAVKPPMIYVNTFFAVAVSELKLYVPAEASSAILSLQESHDMETFPKHEGAVNRPFIISVFDF